VRDARHRNTGFDKPTPWNSVRLADGRQAFVRDITAELDIVDSSLPLVAVLMCVYRGDDPYRFGAAVQSLLAQTYPLSRVQIFLGIDGPLPKELEDVVEEYRRHFYKIHRNPSNSGLSATLNSLIGHLSRERYVFRMDADDRSHPERFATQVRFMEHHPEIDVLGTALTEVNGRGEEIARRVYPRYYRQVRRYITKASPVAHATVCFRGSFFERFGNYPTRYRTSQDVALWFRALAAGAVIVSIPDVVYEVTTSDDLFARRSASKALDEFGIYINGIWRLHGFTWRYVFPVGRLLFRLTPLFFIRAMYSSVLRRRMLNASDE
jgi:glycosyltransferase involved in cell wall biosynthesis